MIKLNNTFVNPNFITTVTVLNEESGKVEIELSSKKTIQHIFPEQEFREFLEAVNNDIYAIQLIEPEEADND